MADHSKRRESLGYLRKIAQGQQIICLQETHGYQEEIFAEIKVFLPGWAFFHSPVCLQMD